VALKVAKKVVENEELWGSYKHYERMQFLLPLAHSENVKDTSDAVDGFEKLIQECKDANCSDVAEKIENSLAFAEEMNNTIIKYQRFPRRNEVLGRPTTMGEQTYLQD